MSTSGNHSAPEVNLQYSKNNKSWREFKVKETVVTLKNIGDKIYIRAGEKGNTVFSVAVGNDFNNNFFKMSGKISVSGNIMSLLNQNFENLDTIPEEYCFYCLFYKCVPLISAKNLKLPAKNLTDCCYSFMFDFCHSLEVTPKLPATTLAVCCYEGMFNSCTSLLTAPKLPATTLAGNCYQNMFTDCSSLSSAPELPVTTLAYSCYNSMFYGCTSLKTPPELPATELTERCYKGMFRDCTSLTTAPELPATELAEECYCEMFQDCTSLNNVKVAFTEWSPSNATSNWLENVSSSGTFICPKELPDIGETSNIPYGWTVERF